MDLLRSRYVTVIQGGYLCLISVRAYTIIF